MIKNIKKIIFFVFLYFFSFLARFFPHPPNFAPIGAFSLISGAHLSKKLAFFLPISLMLFSDFFLGFYEKEVMLSVYGSFFVYVILGNFLKNNKKILNLMSISFLGSLFFFLITNFAVWAFTRWYEKNFSGFILCFSLALPFFKNTVLGDIFYSFAFFTLYSFFLEKNFSLKFSSLYHGNYRPV